MKNSTENNWQAIRDVNTAAAPTFSQLPPLTASKTSSTFNLLDSPAKK